MNRKQNARLERYSQVCGKCGGLGEITRYFGGGKYESTIDCDRCRGRGLVGNCTDCEGTGLVDAIRNQACSICGGVGALGNCTDCAGTGIVSAENGSECPNCRGFGYLPEPE